MKVDGKLPCMKLFFSLGPLLKQACGACGDHYTLMLAQGGLYDVGGKGRSTMFPIEDLWIFHCLLGEMPGKQKTARAFFRCTWNSTNCKLVVWDSRCTPKQQSLS